MLDFARKLSAFTCYLADILMGGFIMGMDRKSSIGDDKGKGERCGDR
jgi:hypothetical protein